MKRILCGLTLVLILFCSSCTNSNQQIPPDSIVDSVNAVNEIYGVSIVLDQSEYSIDTKKIIATIKNNSDFTIGCEPCWQLEKYDSDNGFVVSQYESEPAFRSYWSDASPRGKIAVTIDLSYYGKYLQPGKYRIVVGPIIIEDNNCDPITYNGIDRFVLCAEFSIK